MSEVDDDDNNDSSASSYASSDVGSESGGDDASQVSSSVDEEAEEASRKQAERLNGLKRSLESRDAALEPRLVDVLAQYREVGGDLTEAGRVLAKGCVGYGACASVLREWLAEVDGEDRVRALEMDAACREVSRIFDPRSLDDSLFQSGASPDWLLRLAESGRGRRLLFELEANQQDSVAVAYALRKTAVDNIQEMLDEPSFDLTRDVVLFQTALLHCLKSPPNTGLDDHDDHRSFLAVKRLVTVGSRRLEAFTYATYVLSQLPHFSELRRRLALEVCCSVDDSLKEDFARAALRHLPRASDEELQAAVDIVARKQLRTYSNGETFRLLFREPVVLHSLATASLASLDARRLLAVATSPSTLNDAVLAARAATLAALEWLVEFVAASKREPSVGSSRDDELEKIVRVAPCVAQLALAAARTEKSLTLQLCRAVIVAQPSCRRAAVDLLLRGERNSRSRDVDFALVEAVCLDDAAPDLILDVLSSSSSENKTRPYFLAQLARRASPPFSVEFLKAAAALLVAHKSILFKDERFESSTADKANIRTFTTDVHTQAVASVARHPDLRESLSVLSKLASRNNGDLLQTSAKRATITHDDHQQKRVKVL